MLHSLVNRRTTVNSGRKAAEPTHMFVNTSIGLIVDFLAAPAPISYHITDMSLTLAEVVKRKEDS